MRVGKHTIGWYAAALLVWVAAVFAVTPSDLFFRSQAGTRTRVVRTTRLEDHDVDHSLEATDLSHEQASTSWSGLDLFAVQPGSPPDLVPYLVGQPFVLILPPSAPVSGQQTLHSGRAPPRIA